MDHGQGHHEACEVGQLGECPSKGAAAERLKASLDKLWGEAANFDTDRLRSFLDTLGASYSGGRARGPL